MPTWTKRHIVDGFVRLLHMHSYPSITVEMILAQTDVSKTTFYRYFRNKSDVMDAYFQQVYDAAILDEGCRDLEDLFAAILEKARRNPEQYRMFETTGYNSYRQFIYRYALTMGTKIIETSWGRKLSEVEAFHVAFFCAGGSHAVEEFSRGQSYRSMGSRQAAAEIASMMNSEYKVAIDEAMRANLREYIRRRDG